MQTTKGVKWIDRNGVARDLDNELGALDGAITAESSRAQNAEQGIAATAGVALTTANNAIPASQKGANSGVAPLDGSGKVPVENLPSGITPKKLLYSQESASQITINLTPLLTLSWPKTGEIYIEVVSGIVTMGYYGSGNGLSTGKQLAAISGNLGAQNPSITRGEALLKLTVSTAVLYGIRALTPNLTAAGNNPYNSISFAGLALISYSVSSPSSYSVSIGETTLSGFTTTNCPQITVLPEDGLASVRFYGN